MERVDVLKAREGLNGGGETLGEGFGGEFDFSRVKSSNSADLEASSNLHTMLVLILLVYNPD
jgi:hypothetical protein